MRLDEDKLKELVIDSGLISKDEMRELADTATKNKSTLVDAILSSGKIPEDEREQHRPPEKEDDDELPDARRSPAPWIGPRPKRREKRHQGRCDK